MKTETKETCEGLRRYRGFYRKPVREGSFASRLRARNCCLRLYRMMIRGVSRGDLTRQEYEKTIECFDRLFPGEKLFAIVDVEERRDDVFRMPPAPPMTREEEEEEWDREIDDMFCEEFDLF